MISIDLSYQYIKIACLSLCIYESLDTVFTCSVIYRKLFDPQVNNSYQSGGQNMEGKTLSEKIISEHCGKDVKAGEIVVVNVDLSYVQDGTGPLTVRRMAEMGLEK